jgi:neutral ceramidase
MRLLKTLLVIGMLAVQTLAAEGSFRAGAASVVITPPAGTPMAGYYRLRTADGVLDELYARALVVEQAGLKAAFVTLDLITVTRKVTLAAREIISTQTGIPVERVMISATHSHTGPVLGRDSAIDSLTGGDTPPVQTYSESLPALIARSVAEANARLVPAQASTATGREHSLGFNRRFWLSDGTVAWNPPKLSPTIVAPAGPTDPDVGVLLLEKIGTTPTPLATYVNFALHPDVVGGSRISADYPGSLARRLADVHGPEMVTLFANGCCGNVNHRNIWWANPQSGPTEMERIGAVLAGAVLKTWPNLQRITTFGPRARSAMVSLPLPKFTDEDRREARETMRRMTDPKVGTVAKAKAVCILDTLAREGKPIEVEVQAIALSRDVAIVGLPGEIFAELGLALKKASPFKHTFIAELANGSIGYIPIRSAYAEGNYEVVSARVGEGAGERLVDEAAKLLGLVLQSAAEK